MWGDVTMIKSDYVQSTSLQFEIHDLCIRFNSNGSGMMYMQSQPDLHGTVENTYLEYYIDLIVNPGAVLEHDCFFNSSLLPVASPLRLPDFKSSGTTDEDRSWGRNSAFDIGFLDPSAAKGACQPYEVQSGDFISRCPGQDFDLRFSLWSNSLDDPNVHPREGSCIIFKDTTRMKNLLVEQAKAWHCRIGGPNDILAVDSVLEKVNVEKPFETSRLAPGIVIQDSSKPDAPNKSLEGKLMWPNTVDRVSFHDKWEIPWEEIVLKERIGGGSFGTVHRADWHGSDVAVKILFKEDLSEEQVNEFMGEVVAAVAFQGRRLQIPKDMNSELITIIESCWASDPRQQPSFAGIMNSLKQIQKSSMPPS